MKRHRIRRMAFWIAFQSLLLAAPGSGNGYVLCVGDDGHIAVEAAGEDGRCTHPPDGSPSVCSRSSPVRGEDRCEASCGPCRDIPSISAAAVRTDLLSASVARDAMAGTADAPTLSPSSLTSDRGAARGFPLAPIPPAASTHPSIGSTVLRI